MTGPGGEGGGEGGGEAPRLTREQSRARTRRRLLESAAAVFAERGFAGASVEEVAERAGFSRGAFYSNFASKDDVFLALLDHHIEAGLRSLQDARDQGSPPEALFELLRAGTMGRMNEPRAWTLLWAEFWLHVVRNPELAPKLAARQRAARAALASLVEAQCQELGATLPMPAEELASLMLAVDDGLKLQEHLDPSAVPADLRARALVFFLRHLAPGAGSGRRPDPAPSPADLPVP